MSPKRPPSAELSWEELAAIEADGGPDESLDLLCRVVRELCDELAKYDGNDEHPENRCKACSGRNIAWFTESPEWNRATELDGRDRRELIWCPICFVQAAEAKDGGGYSSWILTRGDRLEAQRQIAGLMYENRALCDERDQANELLNKARDVFDTTGLTAFAKAVLEREP